MMKVTEGEGLIPVVKALKWDSNSETMTLLGDGANHYTTRLLFSFVRFEPLFQFKKWRARFDAIINE